MNDPTLINSQALFSAVFIFIGIMVFYVASLFSGHNIYRDLEFQHSSMLSVVVGSILFLLLPIGYIIFMPDLFDPLLTLKSSRTEVILSIHKNLIEKALWPFILVSFGLGIVFGCTTLLKARWELLIMLKKVTGISFYITSYDFAWDHFLMAVKKHTPIAVELGDKSWVKGFLINYSIKKEPKQLILEGYQIASKDFNGQELQKWLENEEHDPSSMPWKGLMLITEADEIKKIAIHGKSLKKHRHGISHTTQASYCSLLAFGFFLLFAGLHYTYEFIDSIKFFSDNEFQFLKLFYCVLFWVFWLLSIGSLITGVILLGKDYPSLHIAMVLNRSITFMIGFFTFVIILFLIHFYGETIFGYHLHILLTAFSGLLLLLIYYIYSYHKPGAKIETSFKKLYDDCRDKTKHKHYLLSHILTYFCDEMDLNNSDPKSEYEKLEKYVSLTEDEALYIQANKLFEYIKSLMQDKELGLNENANLNIIIKLKSYCTLWDEKFCT